LGNIFNCLRENQTVIEELTNAIVVIDREGIVNNVNARALELLGVTAEYALGRHMQAVYPESKLTQTILTGDTQRGIKLKIQEKNCIASRVPLYAEGEIVGAVSIFDDVTRLEQLSNRIEADRNEMSVLKTILELAYDGIIVVDANGYITMISEAYKKFLNIELADVVGKHVTEVIENTRMHIVAQTGVPEVNDFQEIRGDYMVATRMPYYVNGKIAGAIGKVIFRNVSELQNINKKFARVEKEIKNLKSEISSLHKAKYSLNQIITNNEEINKLKNYVNKLAHSKSSVLIQGESGTGKELFAHAIHLSSHRRDMPFVKVNCAAIPENLLESELFGYEKGSFTGADKNGRIGKFELADQGTIFLDEIGDMPLHMQAKILRVLQEGEVERVGSNSPKQIDVRIIAATNRNLKNMVEEKAFREDLYYRLNVINFTVPPLRERKEDIILLSKHFIDLLNRENHGNVRGLSEKAQMQLSSYDWKGNIRELKNVIERAYNIIEGEEFIQLWHLPTNINNGKVASTGEPLKELVDNAEKKIILERLISFSGNKTKTAADLGISRMALHKKLEKFEMK
jgi:PAS domain S-box-containing protein